VKRAEPGAGAVADENLQRSEAPTGCGAYGAEIAL